MPGFFNPEINFPIICNFEFSKYVDGISLNLKNGMKKAVATISLSEKECSMIKLAL